MGAPEQHIITELTREKERLAARLAEALQPKNLFYCAKCDVLVPRSEIDPHQHPIDVMLYCPRCLWQHVDAPEPGTAWTNPPHRSHKCHACGTIWRPADVPTNGIVGAATRGKVDTWPEQPDD